VDTRIPIYGRNIDRNHGTTPCQGSIETIRSPPDTKITTDSLKDLFCAWQPEDVTLRDSKPKKIIWQWSQMDMAAQKALTP
jgi:hypothetical protein